MTLGLVYLSAYKIKFLVSEILILADPGKAFYCGKLMQVKIISQNQVLLFIQTDVFTYRQ